MCCCYISSCCCGCKPLKEGVFLLALLNLLLDVVLVALPWIIPTQLHVEGLTTWLVILCATNIILAVGVKAGNKYLLVPWLVAHVMQTILSFLVGPILLGLAAFMKYKQKSSSFWSQGFNNDLTSQLSGTSGLTLDQFILPGDQLANWDTPIQNLGQQWNGSDWQSYENPDDERHDRHNTGQVVGMVVSVLLPPWYIYCVVAVSSLYKKLERKEENHDGRRHPRTNRFSFVRTVSVVDQPSKKPMFISGGRSPPIYPGSHQLPPPQQIFISGGRSPPMRQMMTPLFSPPSPAVVPNFQPMPVMQPLRPMYGQQEPPAAFRMQAPWSGAYGNGGGQGYNNMPPSMPYYHM